METHAETHANPAPLRRRLSKTPHDAASAAADIAELEARAESDLAEKERLEEQQENLAKKPPGCKASTWTEICRRTKDDDFDIFTDYGDLLVADGVPVKYDVYRNGAMLGSLEYPMDWGTIQKKFGGGQYNVRIKYAGDGMWKKRQPKTLAEPQTPPESAQSQAQLAQGSQAITFENLRELIREEREHNEKITREMIRAAIPAVPVKSAAEDALFFMKFMEMQSAQHQSSTALLIEAMKSKETPQRQAGDPMDPLALMDILDRREDRVREQMREIMEEREERREKTSSNKDGSVWERIAEQVGSALIEKAPAVIDAYSKSRAAIPVVAPPPQATRHIPRQQPRIVPSTIVQPQGAPVAESVKDKVFRLLEPKLTGWITSGKSTSEAAQAAEEIFKTNGLTRQQVISAVSDADIASLNVPAFAVKWLRAFYEDYRKQPDTGVTS